MNSPHDWQRRFEQQAQWTEQVRSYLFNLANVHQAGRILEPGCGTGAVLGRLPEISAAEGHGIDIRPDFLLIAKKSDPSLQLLCADVSDLPYRDKVFDICWCHYFLLWVDPPTAMAEMIRVTRSGGFVLALAEPDYGGRIDYPDQLVNFCGMQAQSLKKQGAFPEIGRRLAAIFRQAGLLNVLCGVTGGYWGQPPGPDELAMEWEVLKYDLGQLIPADEMASKEKIDRQAWLQGERILYIPTFYALGQVP